MEIESFRTSMSGDVLHSWAADAQKEIQRLRDELAEVKRDSERYRWLTYDHDDAEQRKRCREIWDHGCVMSYSALSADIDAAMAGGAE